jgi:putative transposase
MNLKGKVLPPTEVTHVLGAWRDNVFVERRWQSVKYEEIYLRAYDSVAAAKAGIQRYFS